MWVEQFSGSAELYFLGHKDEWLRGDLLGFGTRGA